MTDRLAGIAETITRDGFAYVHAPEMRGVLQAVGLRDWDSFAGSWDDLGVDTYMADGGRYRRRRFAAFRAAAGIARKPHQPHYQSRDYNPLHGGIERWFEPVTDAIGAHPGMRALLCGWRCRPGEQGLGGRQDRPHGRTRPESRGEQREPALDACSRRVVSAVLRRRVLV